METKQTAVNFLYEFVLLKLSNVEQMQFQGLFQQAKQMEKGQISKAYRQSVEEDVWNNPLRTGEEYYNETYESK